MMPEYKRTFMDRYAGDSGYLLRIIGRSAITAMMFGGIFTAKFGFLAGIVGGVACGLFTYIVSLIFSHSAAAGVKKVLATTGSSTPYQKSFSYQESLAIRGDVAGALRSYEELIAEHPLDPEVRVRAAELYSRNANPARAAELFRDIQRIPGISRDRLLYAAHRLIDLYRGPLDDEGRALVELRKIVDLFPDSPAGIHARAALAEIKRSRAVAAPD